MKVPKVCMGNVYPMIHMYLYIIYIYKLISLYIKYDSTKHLRVFRLLHVVFLPQGFPWGKLPSGGASPPHGEKIQTQEAMPEFSETGVDRVWMLCGIQFFSRFTPRWLLKLLSFVYQTVFVACFFDWWCYVIIGYKALTGGTCRKNMKKVLGFRDVFQKNPSSSDVKVNSKKKTVQ